MFSDEPPPFKSVFTEAFDGQGSGWGDAWTAVRYESAWGRDAGRGGVTVGPAPARSLEEDARQTEYMGEPFVLASVAGTDMRVRAEVRLKSDAADVGVLCRWSFDEAYALLIRNDEILLCRYGVKDRIDLARKPFRRTIQSWTATLTADGNVITGVVEGLDDEIRLRAVDKDPLGPGAAGVLANPTSSEVSGTGMFRSVEVFTREDPRDIERSFIYRFTGGMTDTESGVDVRVAARTVLPAAIGFEITPEEGETTTTEPVQPQGKWGSVRYEFRDLAPGSRYTWRPFTGDGDARIYGPEASFITPSLGRGVTFAYGSCTSGRHTDYSSFSTAATFDPEFYLHAGDWGYVNLNSLRHGPDHFQARWARLLRVGEMQPLLDRSALMLWQDDHDYQADNGWSETIAPYTVWAFDEFHANPTDEYFDLRWGDLHIWCLDCRLFATDPSAPDGPAKSRLGAKQKAWLKESMTASDAPVRVVASGMVFRNKVLDDDGWHSTYAHERDELLQFFSELPSTTFILSGDSHGHRLIHHFEFGELYEVTASATDFPPEAYWQQGNNDPEHTLENHLESTGFAIVDLDPPGDNRKVRIRSIRSADGGVMFEKILPVRG